MYIIAIAGGSGSGKTTFAHKVLKELPQDKAFILSMDSYYLSEPPKEHYTSTGHPNFDHPESFDWKLLAKHISELKMGRSIEMPHYCFKSHRRLEETQTVYPTPIIICEGIFSLFDEKIRSLMDLKCFLHVDADIRFTRRLHRDLHERGRSLDSIMAQYYETVRPMYQKFLDPQKQYANIIIGEETDTAAIVVAARLKEIIAEQSEDLNREA